MDLPESLNLDVPHMVSIEYYYSRTELKKCAYHKQALYMNEMEKYMG